jgi:PAS domain S-box-containing protein
MDHTTFAHVVELVAEGVVVLTQNCQIQYVNRAFKEMTGYSLTDLQRASSVTMPGPDTDHGAIARIEAAIAAAEKLSGEILSYRRSGEPFWNAFSIEPHLNKDGSVRHLIYIARDISYEKQAEHKASKLERDYRFIFENIKSAITVHGADSQIRVANPSAVELLGIGNEDLEGSTPGDPIFQLFREDGSEMPLEEYPLIRAINHRCAVKDFIAPRMTGAYGLSAAHFQ